MCGIAGIHWTRDLSPEKLASLPDLARAMCKEISHRGPDDEGLSPLSRAVLAHRRLSIIDPSGGAQPMQTPDGVLHVSYNGEIFNYLELREELERLGVSFRTNSDTEVLLAAFREWDTRCFARLNGQFAIALFDEPRRRLILARDRMGEKPLFFKRSGDLTIFASAVRPILSAMRGLGETPELDYESVWHYHSLNYVPFERSFVRGVAQLEPGTFLELTGEKESVGSFRRDEPAEAAPGTPDEAALTLSELIADATRLRLRSDAPLGIFLSGGLDSTAIACAMASNGAKTRAFIADFRESGFSEADAALEVCRRLGLEAELVEIAPRVEELPLLLKEIVAKADTPLGDSSSLPVYLLSKHSARSVKTVLSGDGGDELFGGYLTYRATRLASTLPRLARRMLGGLHGAVAPVAARSSAKVGAPEKLERLLRNLHLPPGAAHFAWNGMAGSSEKERLLGEEVRRGGWGDTFALMAERLEVDADRPRLADLLVADQRGYLANDILVKADRMSMAHGLEVRPVFMDQRIVSFARSLPESHLISGGASRVVLRRVVARQAPWYRLDRPKQGFSIPVHAWLRGPLRELASDLVHSRTARTSGLYEQRYLEKLWSDHLARRRNLGFELWGILVALIWWETCFKPH